jgi:hypothetical protein
MMASSGFIFRSARFSFGCVSSVHSETAGVYSERVISARAIALAVMVASSRW